jgi:hypothetical protein
VIKKTTGKRSGQSRWTSRLKDGTILALKLLVKKTSTSHLRLAARKAGAGSPDSSTRGTQKLPVIERWQVFNNCGELKS